MRNISIRELCIKVELEMIKSGYSDKKLFFYKYAFENIIQSISEEKVSLKIFCESLQYYFQIPVLTLGDNLNYIQSYYARIFQILVNFYLFEKLKITQYNRVFIVWPENFISPINQFISKLLEQKESYHHIERNICQINHFLIFIKERNINNFSNVKKGDFEDFYSYKYKNNTYFSAKANFQQY